MNPLIASPDTLPRPAGSPSTKTARTVPYEIEVVPDRAGLRERLADWEDLARQAIEPNVFYEPWYLLPALEALPEERSLFVLVWQPVNAQRRKPVLCGFFPLVARRLHALMPVRVLANRTHIYNCLATPLLRQGHPVEVLTEFLGWLRTDPRGAALWQLDQACGDGPFARALTETCYRLHRPMFQVDAHCRAAYHPDRPCPPGGDASAFVDSYLSAGMPRKRIREYRRAERLLGERGRLERRVLQSAGELSDWTEAFLNLEAEGWKGKEGTAIACSAAHADFFRVMLRGAFERGQLMLLGLFLDGKPVAMKCNLLSGGGSFAFKIAYDEAYAAHSPGVLLEMVNLELLARAGNVRWMDSCAIPDHFMINRLWQERRVIQSFYLATGRAPGDLVVSMMPLGRWLKRTLCGTRSAPGAGRPEVEE